ncbi:MAG TPA: hypothetical protein VNX15_00110 [Gemmatimonadales bacterium]|nr:hypothetical protein [Gemmatimonadales bacterium]
MRIVLLLSLVASWPLSVSGQDSTRAIPTSPDTLHEVRAINALWRSMLLPGWGQAVTHRSGTGAAFAAWEGVTIMMTLKAQQEADYFSRTGSPNVRSKRQEVQDWTVLWVFNHLFSGAEAFVSAHLQDFPKDLHFQAFPRGVGVSVPIGPW